MNLERNPIVEQMAKRLATLTQSAGDGTMAPSKGKGKGQPAAAPVVDAKAASRIAAELLSEALRNGLALPDATPAMKALSGGNTALQVSIASAEVNFVFKMDVSPKLTREARTIEDLRQDTRLGMFAAGLPRVYAQHSDSVPYAYLMEWFDEKIYPSLKQLFFNPKEPLARDHAKKIALYALDALAEGYRNSRDERLQVRMMGEAYYKRIEDSLSKAAKDAPEDFEPVPLTVNGVATRSWRAALDTMLARQEHLQALAPPFMTVVHGDPNPGNILVKRNGPTILEVKFIDLKDWKYGDYLFDIAKLTHFLLYTGPLEELKKFKETPPARSKEGLSLNYKRPVPGYIEEAVAGVYKRTGEIAKELQDPMWEPRYKLAMAANVLGLIPGRLKIGYVSQARILYAEGMLLLEDFLSGWEKGDDLEDGGANIVFCEQGRLGDEVRTAGRSGRQGRVVRGRCGGFEGEG